MPNYLASQIIRGKKNGGLCYFEVTEHRLYKPFTQAINDILIKEGREDLMKKEDEEDEEVEEK